VSEVLQSPIQDLKSGYPYCDISAIEKVDYRLTELSQQHGDKNQIAHVSTRLYFGGIRKTLYGNNCLLSKHSLFLPGQGLELFPHVHFVNGARLADVSCVLLHYKFTSNALEIAAQNKARFVTNSAGYTEFIRFLESCPDYSLKQPTAMQFRGSEALVERDFLFMSDRYREHVSALTKNASVPN
jgi:hypothetical protein